MATATPVSALRLFAALPSELPIFEEIAHAHRALLDFIWRHA
jgi:hypothetical protein